MEWCFQSMEWCFQSMEWCFQCMEWRVIPYGLPTHSICTTYPFHMNYLPIAYGLPTHSIWTTCPFHIDWPTYIYVYVIPWSFHGLDSMEWGLRAGFEKEKKRKKY